MVDTHKSGGAIILDDDDDSDKSQNADGSITNQSSSSSSSSESEDTKEYGEDVLYCEECGFSKDRKESSWFPGDACPKCREGYLSAD